MRILAAGRKAVRYLLVALAALTAGLLTGCHEDAVTYRFIGDSIIKRWDLQNSFPTLVTENCGLMGSGLEHLQSYAGRCHGRQVVVMCGTNECWLLPTEEEAADYAVKYVDALIALQAERVYVFSILPRRFENDPEEQYNANIRLMNRAISVEIGARWMGTVSYIDVYDLFLDKDGELNMNLTYDGLHPNPEGYEILTRALNHQIL